MRDSIYRISLDIHNETPQVQVVARKNDSARRIYITLMEHGKPFVYPIEGARAHINIVKPDNTSIDADCDIYSDGKIVYDFTESTADVVGICICEINLSYEDQVSTGTFLISVLESAFDGSQTMEPVVAKVTQQWLTEHPEAYAVGDGTLTSDKFSDDLKLLALKDYVTPQMYGAVGDGETDDTTAFQNAFNSGKDVFVPIGEYVISDSLEVNSGITILGEHPQKTKIFYTGSAWLTLRTGEYWRGTRTIDGFAKRPQFLFEIKTYFTQKPTIKNLHCIGNDTNGLFYINAADSFTAPTVSWGGAAIIEKIFAENFFEPFHIFSSFLLRVQDMYILRCGTSYFDYNGDAFEASRFNNCILFSNVFWNRKIEELDDHNYPTNTVPALHLVHTKDISFQYCQFQGYDRVVYAPSNSRAIRTSLLNCWFENINYISDYAGFYYGDNGNDDLRDSILEIRNDQCAYVKYYSKRREEDGSADYRYYVSGLIGNVDLTTNAQASMIKSYGCPVYPRPYVRRIDDDRRANGKIFYPYNLLTNNASVRVPLNTITKQETNKNTVELSLAAPTNGAAEITVVFEGYLFAYFIVDPENHLHDELFASFKIFKIGLQYHVGAIQYEKRTGVAEAATASVSVINSPLKLTATISGTSDSAVANKIIAVCSYKITSADNDGI